MANVDFDAAQLQWGLVESQVQQRWRCSRDPIYTTKHKQDFQFWLIVKITKISTQQASTGLTWIAVLGFNEAPKCKSSYGGGWSNTPICREKQKKHCKLCAMITIQRCHKRYLHPGTWMPLGKFKSWQCNNANKLAFPYFTPFIWNPVTNRTTI